MLIDVRIAQGMTKASRERSGWTLEKLHSQCGNDVLARVKVVEHVQFVGPAAPNKRAFQKVERAGHRDVDGA